LAFPSPTSKWTNIMIEKAIEMGIPCKVIEVS